MVGMRAMESLRIEKSYRMWGSDLTRDYTPFEAGLDRFVRMDKGEFIGREALARQLAAGVPHRLRRRSRCTASPMRIRSATSRCSRPARWSDAPRPGYYGHVLGKSLAIAYVKPQHAAVGSELEIEILGERRKATVLRESPFDPESRRLRA